MKIVELFVKKLPSSEVYVYTHAGSKLVSAVFYNKITEEAEEVAKKVALQVAAMDPMHLSTEHIPTAWEDEDWLRNWSKESGKPEAVIPNIVAGKLNKRYSEIVLMEQGYMGDEVAKIKDIVNGKAEVEGFERIAFAN